MLADELLAGNAEKRELDSMLCKMKLTMNNLTLENQKLNKTIIDLEVSI